MAPKIQITPELAKALTPKLNKYIPGKPHPKQSVFLLLTNKEVMFGGAGGGGKSSALLMSALQYVEEPGYNAIILRKTFRDLSLPDAIMTRARQWLAPFTASGEVKWKEKDHRFIFPSGATLSFGYLDTPNDKYGYQGAQFHFCAFDELTQFRKEDYQYLFSRLRRDSESRIPIRMRSATNPGGVGHTWVKERFVDHPNTKDRIFLPSNVLDNPSIDYDSYVESLNELDPVTRAQMLNGDWHAKPEGLIYPELEDCVVHDWPSHIAGNRFGGIDWGFNDPQVFLAATVDANGVIWIDYERYVRGKPLSQHLEELPPSAREVTWYADPAQPSLIEEMRRNDYVVRKANNSIIEGINKVKSMIRKGKLKIHPSCKALIAESNLYRWKNQTELDENKYGDTDGGRYDVPIDKHNHCLIAGTLVLTKSGLKNIEDISAGDFVVSPNGFSEVLWSGKTRELATIFTLEMEDGRFLQGTECHPVQKENGEWIPLGDLMPGDRIRSLDFDEYQSWLEKDRTLIARRWYSTGRSTGDTPIRHDENVLSTTHPALTKGSIGRSGNITTDRFPTDTTSTTKTGILSTTISTIWSACTVPITFLSTWTKKGEKKRSNGLKQSGLSPSHGTSPKREGLGTENTPNRLPKTSSRSRKNAKFAAVNTKQNPATRATNSAEIIANRRLGGCPESTTSIELAKSAAEHFPATNTQRKSFAIATVLRVTGEGIKLPVYNLELDESEYDNKAFFANGILVHNCLDALRYLSSAVARLYDDYSADLTIIPDNDTRKLKKIWKPSEGPYENTSPPEESPKPVDRVPWWEDTSFVNYP